MAEIKLPRLLGAAKEFNIGQETLVGFLVGKGFESHDLKSTSKISEEMYRALQLEFQSDKVAKLKSDQIDLPKGGAVDKKKKDEEEIVFRKEKEYKKIEIETVPEIKVSEVEITRKVEETPEVVAKDEEKPSKKQVAELSEIPEVTNIESKGISGPKVVDKIDLSTIDSSTSPKKGAKIVIKIDTTDEDQSPLIENIKTKKLEGPKILGKIQLPVDSNTRPVKEAPRKRKRIPIEKKNVPAKGVTFNRPAEGGNRFNQPAARSAAKFGGPAPRRDKSREDKVIDEKEIQEKIRQTQAKLAGSSGKGKSLKAKYRKARRGEMAEAQDHDQPDNKLQLTEFISVSELANLMNVSFAEVISKCMGLGIMVSINQRLDAEVIELVAGEFNFDVEFIDMEKQMSIEETDEEDDESLLVPRHPIVTIMGHVDHGKTSLLDYIRHANVVADEAGGITQHIGAYRVQVADDKVITFLDTPGHEAFTAMRARGAKVTDIAVIVIAADDAIMPQTREAISHAQAAGVQMIFAINKIDKDGANPQKIYEQLSQMNILVEEWGGKFQSQEISAKQGLNIDKLLEKILLEAELLELKANPKRDATGTVIEASLDKGRGYVATILVQNGTMNAGDVVVSGQYFGRVKAMFNERTKKITTAPPSTPVMILGLNGAPQAGEKFKVYQDESSAKDIATRRAQILREQGIRTKKHITLDEIGRRLALGSFKELKIIIKGDVDGSVEALSDSIQKLSTEEILVSVIHKGVGGINESDVVLAEASDAIIIGFNVRPSMQSSRLADQVGIEIKTYSIIYNAIEEIKSAMEGMLEPKIQEKVISNVEIKEVFRFDKAVVAGCQVLDGKIKRDSKIRIIRDGIVVYPTAEGVIAELASLKRYKDDAKEVLSGMECGITIKNYNDIKAGDIIEAYEVEEVKRTL